MSKFTIEYQAATGQIQIRPVLDVFPLAVVNMSMPTIKEPNRFVGLNMAIILDDSKSSIQADADFSELFKIEPYLFTIYLNGDKGVKIPVEIHSCHGRNEKQDENRDFGYPCKTSCYFGYIHPLMFDTDKQGKFWNV